jgi:GNAT superfamily N-acetyltransferase
MSPTFTPPRPIRAGDDLAGFAAGAAELDDWLRRRALANETTGASRTFVTCPSGDGPVAGYYALAAGSIDPADAPGRVRRNMPLPIPVVVLARLAVDRPHQGLGLGSSLLRDAIVRSVAAASEIGLRAMLVHALGQNALAFYERLGFTASPPRHLTYVATLTDLRQTLGLG